MAYVSPAGESTGDGSGDESRHVGSFLVPNGAKPVDPRFCRGIANDSMTSTLTHAKPLQGKGNFNLLWLPPVIFPDRRSFFFFFFFFFSLHFIYHDEIFSYKISDP